MLQQPRVCVSTPDYATVPWTRTTVIYKSPFIVIQHCIIYAADKQMLNQETHAIIPQQLVKYQRHETTVSLTSM